MGKKKKMPKSDDLCYYCGMPASDTEHVVPRVVLHMIEGLPISEQKAFTRNRILTVRSCSECNHLLGPTVQGTLAERKRYLKERLRKRYRKILSMQDWTEEELNDLGGHLRGIVLAGIQERNRLRSRIAW